MKITETAGKYLRLNADGRRISKSHMRENRTCGLMNGRWQLHCSTLSRENSKVQKNAFKLRVFEICGSAKRLKKLSQKRPREVSYNWPRIEPPQEKPQPTEW